MVVTSSNEVRIGLTNCNRLYEKIYSDKKLLETKISEAKFDEFAFFNFIVTSWHLYNDWLNADKLNRPALVHKKKKRTPALMLEVMNIARDITNGSKHLKLDQTNMKKKVVAEVHEPEIRDWYSYFIAGPQYAISTESSYYSVSDLLFLITDYFEWLFDDSIQPENFPEKLHNHLKYCKIK